MTLTVQRLGSCTWAVSTRHVGGKAGIVVGSDRTLIVDGGADVVEGAALLETARGVSPGPFLLVYTHGHWDHVRGGAAMAGVGAAAHVDAEPSVRAQLAFAAREPGACGGGSLSSLFDGPSTIDLGGVAVEVIETPGHAPGSICVQVIEDGVLFGGDTVVTAIPPVFADGHSTLLERTLRRLATLDLRGVVPGHGHVAQSAEVSDTIMRRAEYLASVRQGVEQRFGAQSADEVAQALALQRREDGPFDDIAPFDDLVARHERLVRGLIAEVGLRPVPAQPGTG